MSLISFFKKSFASVLDIFFPPVCMSCGNEAKSVCTPCAEKILTKKEAHVMSTREIETVYVLYDYEKEPLAAKIIKHLKYKFNLDLVEMIARMVEVRGECLPWDKVECMVPVPSSEERIRERGFDHTLLLAEKVCERGISGRALRARPLLKKRFHTPPQASLGRKERVCNLIGAFEVNRESPLPETVCLFDDVLTTGSTLDECARTLKRSGVKNVFGLVIAKKIV